MKTIGAAAIILLLACTGAQAQYTLPSYGSETIPGGFGRIFDSGNKETIQIYAPQTLYAEFGEADISSASGVYVFSAVNSGTATVSSGTAAFTTGTADDDDAEGATVVMWSPGLWCGMEARVRVDAPTCGFNVGFTDAQTETADLLPIVCANVQGVTSTATNAALFFFDQDTTTDHIRCIAVNADVDGTSAECTTTAITTNALAQAWHEYRVYITADGDVQFWFDGDHIWTETTGIATNVLLCGYAGLINRSAAARQMDIDYLRMWQGRSE